MYSWKDIPAASHLALFYRLSSKPRLKFSELSAFRWSEVLKSNLYASAVHGNRSQRLHKGPFQ